MNTILTARRPHKPSRGRVLAIEPDSSRGEALRDLVVDRVGGECEIVADADAALRSIGTRVPDLVVTPAFLPPRDEARLTASLRELPGAAHVQVIAIPYLVEWEEAPRGSKVLRFLQRRSMLARPCAPAAVAGQIEEYLETAAVLPSTHVRRTAPSGQTPAARLVPAEQTPGKPLVREEDMQPALAARVHKLGRAFANDRRAAPRRPAGELPWLWTIGLPSGAHARLVDVSSGGALIETTSKISPGTALDLRLVGQDIDVRVSARMMRTEVAAVDSAGVRYRVAAAFSNNLDVRGIEARTAAATVKPSALSDLFTRVLREMESGAGASALRSSFEQGLRRLLIVEDVRIREAPVIPGAGCESVYFTVPAASGASPVLQAIFEPDYRPSANEFRLLKAAAGLAGVLMEFAPISCAAATLLRPEAFDRIHAHRAHRRRH